MRRASYPVIDPLTIQNTEYTIAMSIWYGGDYNPEQWSKEVWDDDVRLMKESGVSLATVGVFAWSRLEPREGEFDFSWLDEVMEKLSEAGISVDLATATASPPPWLTHAHPAILPVTSDGIRLSAGSRQQYCPSSPIYREYAARLVRQLGLRYGEHRAVRLWHVNNEYGCHVDKCYCDVSAGAFRVWLASKYGSVDCLNEAWGTTFWSQIYSSFEEVYPPRTAPTFTNPAQLLDFDRFSSHELLECYRSEARILREVSPRVPLTTNFLGFTKRVDYWEWAPEVDVVSYDSYPDPTDPDAPARAAMSHDLMRSLKGGQPWLLMEQASSAVSWNMQNPPKAPGQMRAWSYQALARGADGILFFQWRQSLFGAEKFLPGMVPHGGVHTRIWREVKKLGREIGQLDGLQGTSVQAHVAVVLDWDSWWAVEQDALPAHLSYVDTIFSWYRELYERNVVVDFVSPSSALHRYKLVIVPALFVASGEATSNLDAYVRNGGHLLVTYQTGIVDERLHISPEGYLGCLQGTLGVCIEEFAPIVDPSTVPSSLGVEGPVTGRAKANVWSEFLHLRGAEAVAHFTEGPLAEWPALTRNVAGAGIAWYTATLPDQPARSALVGHLLAEAGVHSDTTAPGVELVKRGDLSFAINHRATDAILPTTQDGEPVRARDGLHLDGFDVHIQSAAAPRAAGTDAEGPLSQDPGEER